MSLRKSLASAVVAIAALGLAVGGCSSSGAAKSVPGGSAAQSGSGSNTASADAGVAAANAFLQKYLSSPTSIGIDTPLSRKPAGNKLIVGLNSGSETGLVESKYWGQASNDLGWSYKFVPAGFSPGDEQKAMESAIQLNPNGIVLSGIAATTITAQLAEAKSKGIWVNESASTDQPSGALYDTSIAAADQSQLFGRLVAADVVVQSNGHARIALFGLTFIPILVEVDKGFKQAIAQWCPTCSIDDYPQQGTDIGTKTPQAVVSAVQRKPDTKWLVFDLADAEAGVTNALKAAGLSGLNIAGAGLTGEVLSGLRNGTQSAWTGYSTPIVAYRQIDSLARKFNGDPMVTGEVPTQIITPKTVNSAVLIPGGGSYQGVQDYRSAFMALWKV